MNLCIVLIFATTFTENKAEPHSFKDALPRDELHKTAAQLAKLIHLVSYANVESGPVELTDDGRSKTSTDLQPFDLDYFVVRNDTSLVQKKTNALQGRNQAYLSPGVRPKTAHQVRGVRPHRAYYSRIRPNRVFQAPRMRPNQANVDPGLRLNQAYHSPGLRPQQEDLEDKPNQSYKKTRLHMISNPRVLEEYQKRLLKPLNLHQLSDEDKSTENSMLDQRRNAVFRLDTDSIEKALKSTRNDDLKAKHIPKLLKDVKERNQDIGDDGVDDDNRKKGSEDESLKQDNAWDFITKKYDWNDKHSNEYNDAPRSKKESQKKIHTTKFDDKWNKKVTNQDVDDWDKITKPDTFDDWPKKEKNMKWESAERKPKIKKDFDRSHKKPRKNTDRDVTVFKLSNPRTTKMWKKEKKDDWDKAYAPKISSYHNPRNKKTRNSFASGGFFGRTPIPYIGRQGIYVDN